MTTRLTLDCTDSHAQTSKLQASGAPGLEQEASQEGNTFVLLSSG
jgi:hypothetical protein